MQAHCILDIVSPAQQPSSDSACAHSDFGTHVALSANVRVTPGMQPAHDMSDLAWQGAHNHSGHSQQGIFCLCGYAWRQSQLHKLIFHALYCEPFVTHQTAGL